MLSAYICTVYSFGQTHIQHRITEFDKLCLHFVSVAAGCLHGLGVEWCFIRKCSETFSFSWHDSGVAVVDVYKSF